MIENVQRFGLAAFRGKEWASIVGAKTGAYYFYFLNEAFCRKFSLTLTKAITEAKVRLRTPGHAATNVPDLADQLIKLSQLKRDGLLSETEFEADKRKLLGT